MKIDTLLLSGGGVNCLSFLGSLKYLIESNQMEKDLSNLKTIIGVSGGILHIIPLLIGFSIESTIKLFIGSDYSKLIDYNHVEINNLFNDYGVHENEFIVELLSKVLQKKNYSTEITLSELYKITKIKLVIKTINLSKKKICYFHYKNNPDLSLLTAVKMTTCVPLIFKPINYKGDLYVDGGLCGNFPLEYMTKNKKKYKNYIGLKVSHSKEAIEKESFNDLFEYLSGLYNIQWSPYDHCKNKRIIGIPSIGDSMDFFISKEDKIKIMENGIIEIKKSLGNSCIT
jgi:predicted acylesterase/phospholipase RssA